MFVVEEKAAEFEEFLVMFVVVVGQNGESVGFLGGVGEDAVVDNENTLGGPLYEDAQVFDSVGLLGVLVTGQRE